MGADKGALRTERGSPFAPLHAVLGVWSRRRR